MRWAWTILRPKREGQINSALEGRRVPSSSDDISWPSHYDSTRSRKIVLAQRCQGTRNQEIQTTRGHYSFKMFSPEHFETSKSSQPIRKSLPLSCPLEWICYKCFERSFGVLRISHRSTSVSSGLHLQLHSKRLSVLFKRQMREIIIISFNPNFES